jgi:hypothetical protein
MLITFKSADISAHNLDALPAVAIHKQQNRVRPHTLSHPAKPNSASLSSFVSSARRRPNTANPVRVAKPPVAADYALRVETRRRSRSGGALCHRIGVSICAESKRRQGCRACGIQHCHFGAAIASPAICITLSCVLQPGPTTRLFCAQSTYNGHFYSQAPVRYSPRSYRSKSSTFRPESRTSLRYGAFRGTPATPPVGRSGARPRETPYIQLWNSGVVIAPHAAREEKIGWVRRFRRIRILPTRLFFVRFVPHATDCHRAHRDCRDEAGFTARLFALGNLGTRLRSEHWGVPGQCLRLMSRNTLHSTPSFRRRSCTLLQQHCKSKAGPSGQKFRVASWLHSALFLPRPFFCSAVDCQPADIQLVNFCVYLPVIEFSGAGRLSGVRRAPIDRICLSSAQNPAITCASTAPKIGKAERELGPLLCGQRGKRIWLSCASNAAV